MPRPPRIDFAGSCCHVVARGNNRDEIFRNNEDRNTYLRLLRHSCLSYKIELLAYCLMTNHIHLLLQVRYPNLSKMVERLHGLYAQGFNRRHGHCGHVFQGRFKARMVLNEHALHLIGRYIHMNPVHAGLTSDPIEYPWSSFRGLLSSGERAWSTHPLLRPFRSAGIARAFHAFTTALRPAAESTSGWPAMSEWYKRSGPAPFNKNHDVSPFQDVHSFAPIIRSVSTHFGCRTLNPSHPGKRRRWPDTDARWASLWLLRANTTMRLDEIADELGYRSSQVVGNILVKVRRRILEDPDFRKELDSIQSSGFLK